MTQILQQLKTVRGAENKIDIYLQACREIQYDRPAEARVYAEEALKIARKAKLKERVLHCQRMVGICQYADRDAEGALATFRAALPGYRKLKDQIGESKALQNVGMALRQLGQNEAALEAFRDAERLARVVGDQPYLMTVLTNIGSTYSFLSRPKESLLYFSECLTLAERLDDAGMRARITGNIADVYIGIGDVETAIEWSQRSLDLHRINKDAMGVGLTLSNLGRVYQRIGDLDAALAVMSEALTVMATLRDDHARARVMVVLATILLKKKRYAQAQAIAEEALDIFTAAHDTEREVRCRITLAELAAIAGHTDQARKQFAAAAKRMSTVDNVSLEIEIAQHQADLFFREGAHDTAIKTLAGAVRKPSAQAMHGLRADVFRRISEMYAAQGEWKQALEHERKASDAQRAADNDLRAQHSQALQLRFDMVREARERERVQSANDRLAFQLESKERELNANALAIAQKNELLTDLASDLRAAVKADPDERSARIKEVLRKIDMHRRTGEDWKNFSEQLADVHDAFLKALTSRHTNLTATEVKLASLLKLNLSSKEIAEVLSIGVSTVEVYRANLRKKLELPSGTSLTTFMQTIG